MHHFSKLVLFILLYNCNVSVAEVIVRMEIQQGAVIDNVDIKLYDGEAPVTVTNFLNYVNDGDYDQSFIHRNVPGFVVQGGGFIFDPTLNDGTFSNDPLINNYPGGLQPVPTAPPIVNEFSRSNTRGTISMAKQAGDPDSATSQWFINLADNSASLDIDNGGYTVFGDVLGNGMAVIDTIASQPIFNRTNIHTAFGELPLIDFLSDPIVASNLVRINQVREIFTITPDIDFATVTPGSSLQTDLVITNTGSDALVLGGIADINPVTDPFSIVDAGCANSTIQPGNQCSLTVIFSPNTEGAFSDDFNIEIISHGISYKVTLTGKAATYSITPNINYGTVTTGSKVQPEVTIINTGTEELVLGGIGDIDPVAAPFSILDGGCANSIIQPGDQCSFMVLFSPQAEGDYTDTFNVEIVSHGVSQEVTLEGTGGPAKDEPDIVVSFSSIDFGIVDVLESVSALPYSIAPYVQNNGSLDLTISSIDVSGQDAAEIEVSGNCINVGVVPPGGYCNLRIDFLPLTPGDKSAEVVINTNDPDENPFIIPIRGKAAGEEDGVPASIEDAGPNSGDGNSDCVLDSKQSNVATLLDSYGHYVTYLMDEGYRFSGMTALRESDMAELPLDVGLGSGIFDFTVQNITPGLNLGIGIILPPNVVPSAYYMYGPSQDNPSPHWYKFDFDGETGAVIFNNVTFSDGNCGTFSRNVLFISHKDGGRGDSDGMLNGQIKVTGGMPVAIVVDNGSGSISLLFLLPLFLHLLIIRVYKPGIRSSVLRS